MNLHSPPSGNWLNKAADRAGGWQSLVSAPNTTMTLQFVPIHLAGAAGGALQTGKRIGSAVGAAGLVTVYYRSTASGHDPVAALGHVLVVGVGLILVAVAMAVVELRRSRQPAVSGR